jgi:hypothetical protein
MNFDLIIMRLWLYLTILYLFCTLVIEWNDMFKKVFFSLKNLFSIKVRFQGHPTGCQMKLMASLLK